MPSEEILKAALKVLDKANVPTDNRQVAGLQMKWHCSIDTFPRTWGVGIELDFVNGQEICLTIGPWVIYAGRRLKIVFIEE